MKRSYALTGVGVLLVLVGGFYLMSGDDPLTSAAPEVVLSDDGTPILVNLQRVEEQERADVRTECAHVIEVMRRNWGEAQLQAVGKVITDVNGTSLDEVKAMCAELEGASDDVILARVSELAEAGTPEATEP